MFCILLFLRFVVCVHTKFYYICIACISSDALFEALSELSGYYALWFHHFLHVLLMLCTVGSCCILWPELALYCWKHVGKTNVCGTSFTSGRVSSFESLFLSFESLSLSFKKEAHCQSVEKLLSTCRRTEEIHTCMTCHKKTAWWVKDREVAQTIEAKKKLGMLKGQNLICITTIRSQFSGLKKKECSQQSQKGRGCKRRHPSNPQTTVFYLQRGLKQPLIIRENIIGNENDRRSKEFFKRK